MFVLLVLQLFAGFSVVVVTGASGHIGNNLVRALLNEGRRVRVLVHRSDQGLEGLDLERVQGDVLDYASLCKAFDGAETVFHLAAIISIVGDRDGRVAKTNIGGTANVVRACLECKVKRLVHFSSIHAFSQQPLDEPLDETRKRVESRAPAYDRSKALGELEVKKGIEKGLDAVIVHPTAVIGPNDFRPSRMGRTLIALAKGRMPVIVTGGFDFVDVRDVVVGAISAERRGRCGEHYLLGGRWASVKEVSSLVHKAMDCKVRKPFICLPLNLAKVFAPIGETVARIAKTEPLFTREAMIALNANKNIVTLKARRELGYSPRPLEETISDTVMWFMQNGYI